jgi:hypothetical protein
MNDTPTQVPADWTEEEEEAWHDLEDKKKG